MLVLTANLIGALVPTALLSRLMRWILKRLGTEESPARISASHALAFCAAFVLSAWGNGELGAMAWESGWGYLFPQLFWFGVDLAYYNGRKSGLRTMASDDA